MSAYVLPQKDPRFYRFFLKNYNIPELITGEVKVSPLVFREIILRDAVPVKLAADVDTTNRKNTWPEWLKDEEMARYPGNHFEQVRHAD